MTTKTRGLAPRCFECNGVGFDLFESGGIQRCDYCGELDDDTANEVAWLLVQERLVGGVALDFTRQGSSPAARRHLKRLRARFGL